MRWRTGRRSSNIEDRRGGQRTPMRSGLKLGGGATILVVIVALLLGQDPSQLLGLLGGEGAPVASNTNQGSRLPAGNDEASEFVSVILADTEDTWNQMFAARGAQYQAPTLVLYTDSTPTACGTGTAATGPFYCPGDYKVYLDLGFFRELQRLGAPGDFAQAYVIAHEIGHHVQNITGTEKAVRKLQRQVNNQTQANQLSVLMELQADCYAGAWAHHAHKQRNMLEQGDIEEGLTAAASIGDDRLQRSAGKRVSPDSFTHGSSAQRVEWFKIGLQTGDIDACNTFQQIGG